MLPRAEEPAPKRQKREQCQVGNEYFNPPPSLEPFPIDEPYPLPAIVPLLIISGDGKTAFLLVFDFQLQQARKQYTLLLLGKVQLGPLPQKEEMTGIWAKPPEQWKEVGAMCVLEQAGKRDMCSVFKAALIWARESAKSEPKWRLAYSVTAFKDAAQGARPGEPKPSPTWD